MKTLDDFWPSPSFFWWMKARVLTKTLLMSLHESRLFMKRLTFMKTLHESSWRLFMSLHEDSSSRLLRACRGWHKDSCGAYSKGSCLIEFVKSKWWRRRCIVLWAASILLRRLVEVATHEHTNTMTRHPRTHQHNNLSPTITVHRLCTSRNESCRYHELNQSRTFLKAPQESPRGCHPRTQYIFLHITQWVVRISQPESVTNWIIHKLFTGPARGRGCHPRTQCIVLYITQKVI